MGCKLNSDFTGSGPLADVTAEAMSEKSLKGLEQSISLKLPCSPKAGSLGKKKDQTSMWVPAQGISESFTFDINPYRIQFWNPLKST